MKYYKTKNPILFKILIYSIFILSLVACSKSPIDINSTSSLNNTQVFSNSQIAISYVYDCYSGLKGLNQPATGGFEALTDLAEMQKWGFEAYPGFQSYLQGAITPDNVSLLISGFAPENSWTQGSPSLWNYNYSTIQKCNNFLNNIANVQYNTTTFLKNEGLRMTADIRFIRAMLYFDLVRMFGGVPLITKTYTATQSSSDYQVAKSSFDEMITFITNECDTVNSLLTNAGYTGTEVTRVNKNAALALKARALLYAASPLNNSSNSASKWTLAETATQALLDAFGVSKISTLSADIFKDYTNQEIIFCRTFSSSYNINNFLSLGLNANNPYGYFGLNYDYWPVGPDGQQRIMPTQKFVNMFQTNKGNYPYTSDATINATAVADGSGFSATNPFNGRDPRLYKYIIYPGAGPFNFKPNSTDNRWRRYEFWDSGKGTNPYAANADKNSASGGIFNFGRDGLYSVLTAKKTPYSIPIHTGYLFSKYIDFTVQRAPGQAEGKQIQVYFRLTEFILNMAEIKIALGKEAEAKTLLNLLRTRATMPAIISSGTQLITDYRNERAIELHLEDHRFFDILRWKSAPGMIDAPVYGLTNVTMDWTQPLTNVASPAGDASKLYPVNGAVADFKEGVNAYPLGVLTFGAPTLIPGTVTRNTWGGDKFYRLPIPRDEVNKSGGKIIQNEGY